MIRVTTPPGTLPAQSAHPAPISAPAIVGRAMREDFAALCPHYNFAGWRSLRRNLHRFLRQMERERVPVHGVELVLRGQTPQTAGRAGWSQVRAGAESKLSQKEALVNAAARSLPRSIRAFAEVDPDLWFGSDGWVDDTLAMLERHPCGQPFDTAVWTGAEGEIELERPAAASAGLGVSPWRGHPGFAWAIRRDFFDEVGGWYDAAILGGGDLLWSLAAIGGDLPPEAAAARVGLGAEPDGYLAYHGRVRAAMGDARAGTAPGRIYHEYHGARADRGYDRRAELMDGLRPSLHLTHRRDGVLAWTAAAPRELRRRVAGYFATRKEDS